MNAELRGLRWKTKDGVSRWFHRGERWVGAYESWRLRQGVYVSGKGPMMAFVLGGTVTSVMGPSRSRHVLRAGDALYIEARTPFAFDSDTARMLITEVDRAPGAELGLRRVPNAALPARVREWMRTAWGKPDDVLQAREMATASADACGAWTPFPSVHNTQRLLAVKRHLDETFTENVRLEDVARRFKLDPFYLSRAFSLTTGISPKFFVQALRIEHFLRAALAPSTRSLTRLALEAGATDYSAFCRWTKQRYGAAPSELFFSPDEGSSFSKPEPESRPSVRA
jgi:AraC-like DNA-binding protein